MRWTGSSLNVTNPPNLALAIGGGGGFSVTASGRTPPYTYEWYSHDQYYNPTMITTASGPSLTVANVQYVRSFASGDLYSASVGSITYYDNFWCEVTDAKGLEAGSEAAGFLLAPQIILQPANQHIVANTANPATVRATIDAIGTLTYQWYVENPDDTVVNVPTDGGTTGYTLTLTGVTDKYDGDSVVCAVTNAEGEATSRRAYLNVDTRPVIVTQPQDRHAPP